MKIAISSQGIGKDSLVSEVFGRCPHFAIVDLNNDTIQNIKIITNDYANQAGSAGVSTAKMMAEQNIQAVITGVVGPRAMEVLTQFEIPVYKSSGTIEESINDFIAKKLNQVR